MAGKQVVNTMPYLVSGLVSELQLAMWASSCGSHEDHSHNGTASKQALARGSKVDRTRERMYQLK